MRQVMISGNFNIDELKQDNNVKVVKKMPKRAQERLDALKAAGVDTKDMFAVGEQMIVRLVGGVPKEVKDDDPVYQSILGSKTIPDHKLFRRWVLAQTFRMLRDGYTRSLHAKGYEYQWRMLEEEMRVQTILSVKDPENFEKRNRFFNHDVVKGMLEQYLKDLRKYVDGLKVKHCKGIPYKTIYGKNYFVADIDDKVIRRVAKMWWYPGRAETPEKLYQWVKLINERRTPMHADTPQIKVWVDAYKRAGAYYSMENLIRFHGMRLHIEDEVLSEKASLGYLDHVSKELEGYQMLGLLKKELELNGISVEKKMQEWK